MHAAQGKPSKKAGRPKNNPHKPRGAESSAENDDDYDPSQEADSGSEPSDGSSGD